MALKVALITGASRGMGKVISEHLARNGYFAILVARNEELLKHNCQQVISEGGNAAYYVVDITDLNQIKSCIESVVKDYQRIDLLINNAGITKVGTTEIADDDIEYVLKLNLNGAVFFAKYAALQMKQQGEGYIINLSSLAGKVSSLTLGAYNASKFGLNGFGGALAKEMSGYGVKVTSICPAMVATEMTAGFRFKVEWMIQISDICHTIDYLLKLSPNAIPEEIVINCTTFLNKMAKAEEEIVSPS